MALFKGLANSSQTRVFFSVTTRGGGQEQSPFRLNIFNIHWIWDKFSWRCELKGSASQKFSTDPQGALGPWNFSLYFNTDLWDKWVEVRWNNNKIDHWLPIRGHPGSKCTRMPCGMKKLRPAQSSNKSPLGFRSGRPFLPIMSLQV